jgi:folate-binding protein YgfZ
MPPTHRSHTFHPAAVLRFTGGDHAAFLQGQGTADLRGAPGTCRYCLWLDHRGQIHADGFVIRQSAAAMLLVSYACPAGQLVARFDRHIIADDVAMEDLTCQYELVCMTAEAAGDLLPAAGLALPQAGAAVIRDEHIGYPGRRLGPGTVDLLVPAGQSAAVAGVPMDHQEAERLRIAAGMPLVPVDCPDAGFNPVEANILGAVCATKGCYLGQEVVARVQRLQRFSKRLALFDGPGLPGAVPFPLHIGGEQVGVLTSVVDFPDTRRAIGWLKSRVADGRHTFDALEAAVATLAAT